MVGIPGLTAAPGSQPKIKHGTRSGYRTHKCKCLECRAWKAAEWAAYIERRTRPRPNGWHRYNSRREYA